MDRPHLGEWVAVRVDISNLASNFRANLAATVARTEHDGCDRLLYVCGGVAMPDTVRRHATQTGHDVPVDAVDFDDLLDHWRQRTDRQATAGDTSTPDPRHPTKPQVTPGTSRDRHRSR